MLVPRVLYISYDGMGEPLGQSQVLGYLEPLASEFDITLISFEKRGYEAAALRDQMRRAGIHWRPLRYHGSPSGLSTVWDIARGVMIARRMSRRRGFDLVHVRSYVAGCIALVATRQPLIFDIRGLWADERVEGGLWNRGGLIDRVVRRVERALFARAAAVVTLTRASVPHLRSLCPGPAPIEVITTCTEVERFLNSTPRPDGRRAVWVGSIGPWYRFDLAVEMARAMKLPMQVLTRQTEAAKRVMDVPGTVKQVAPHEIAAELHEGDIGLCLYTSGLSAIGRAPTRAAEYLGTGMPIVVSRGLGDVAELVTREGVGVVVAGEGEPLEPAARRVLELSGDPEVRRRCREIARAEFDRRVGVDAYRELYGRILGARPERVPA